MQQRLLPFVTIKPFSIVFIAKRKYRYYLKIEIFIDVKVSTILNQF
jgi:hypothetical protein